MKNFTLIALLTALCSSFCMAATPAIEPSGTYLFANRDSVELYLDVYEPAAGSCTTIDGKTKPTILFVFGGGFMSGERTADARWFKMLTEAGYRVVANDYRLGLKGFKGAGINKRFIDALDGAIGVAIEDLYSATLFLIENAPELGIDPDNIVISGSSAGAITVMQAEWEICNRSKRAQVLPEGFNYAGVMSFSGAIFTRSGAVRYDREPCPTLIMHGTADKTVPYKQIWFFNIRFAGCDAICKAFRKGGYGYKAYRFEGNGHEIAISMRHNFAKETDFLENNVMKGLRCQGDTKLFDPEIKVPDWGKNGYKTLY